MYKKVISGVMLSVMASSVLFAGGKEASVAEVEPMVVMPEVGIDDTQMDASRFYNVGLTAGTLGAGINVATPINEKFQLRLNINGATYDRTETEEDIDYDADLKFGNAGLLVDYFPFESVGFHLTAGAYYNANKISATGRPTNGTFTIDNVDYQAAEIGSLDADLDFDKFAPYIGIGWGNDSRSEGFGFSIDIGALVGKPQLNLTATRGIVDDATWAQIETSVANEKATIDDDLNDMRIYPVIMVGVTYTF